MIRRFLRESLVSGSEMLLAVALVLVLFLALIGILVLSFPEGTGLQDVYGELVRPRQRDADLAMGSGRETTWVAHLTGVVRHVKERPENAVAWRAASPGMPIGNHHAIQTFDRSGAEISFPERGALRLGQNSLVVVRQPSRWRSLDRRRASLVVLGGEVRGTMTAQDGPQAALDIVTAGASTQIVPSGGNEAEFAVTVNPDNTSTFKVFAGRAEISAGGKTATLGAHEALTVTASGELSAPERIPDPPELLSPPDRHARVHGAIGPRIRFQWSGQPPVERYRLELARDAEFTDLLHVEETRGTSFVHGNLEPGNYYWRVTGVSGNTEGLASSTRALRLVEDLDPPHLQVVLPAGVVHADQLVVTGATEPGAEVLIGEARVATDDAGDFEYAVALRPGPNVIVVEAVDAAGNVSYHSQYVNAKF